MIGWTDCMMFFHDLDAMVWEAIFRGRKRIFEGPFLSISRPISTFEGLFRDTQAFAKYYFMPLVTFFFWKTAKLQFSHDLFAYCARACTLHQDAQPFRKPWSFREHAATNSFPDHASQQVI
jgi:hypothetical protein